MQERASLRHPMQLYSHVRECLVHKERISLATVISRSGSGPREAGASIVITEHNKTRGTIGGGLLEAKTLEMAKAAIHDRRPACQTFSLTDQEVSETGMLCGGIVEVLVDYMDSDNPAYLEIFEKLLQNQKKGHLCWLVRSIRTLGNTGAIETGLGLVDDEGCHTGSLYIAGLDIQTLIKECQGKEPVLIVHDDTRYFIQQIDLPETVFIFGAGHVGQELATISNFTGFWTVVIDDRREFANVERFPTADEIIVTDSFADCFNVLTVNASAYVVIVTRGHACDQIVLSRALKTSAGYIGMIASRRKRDIIFRSLIDEGFFSEDLACVHSPVGLDIGARTPAEIAVSIVAQLISVRTKQEKRRIGQRM